MQLFDAAYANMSAHRVLDVRSQSLMSWSKEAAKLNMSAHANAAGRDELGRGESNTIARRGDGRTVSSRHAAHVPAVERLVEGSRTGKHRCTRTHEAEAR